MKIFRSAKYSGNDSAHARERRWAVTLCTRGSNQIVRWSNMKSPYLRYRMVKKTSPERDRVVFLQRPGIGDGTEQVWKENLSIAQSLSRLKAAKAAKDVANASWFPTVDLNGTSKSESFMFGERLRRINGPPLSLRATRLIIRPTWRHPEGGCIRTRARQDVRAVRITVSATYADAWFQHREAIKTHYRAQRNTSKAFFLTRPLHGGLATAATSYNNGSNSSFTYDGSAAEAQLLSPPSTPRARR